MEKREPEQQREDPDRGPDPRWARILVAVLTAVAAVAGCVEQLAR
jgi:hypothetical protein